LADIRPFRAVHYNPSEVGGLARVVCPPYDVITPEIQLDLYRRSEFNFVRVEFGRDLPRDRDTENRYARAAITLERWLQAGVLTVDKTPALYVDEHRFIYQGRLRSRRSITCRVRLEEWDSMVIRPHEGTLAGAKGDRLNLMSALQANTSPVMALYEDGEGRIADLLARETRRSPTLLADEIDGESHRLWSITGDSTVSEMRRALADQPLYIADGHHRYESALAYRRARRAGSASAVEETFDFVMMTLVDFTDPGLVILPAHRLVRGVAPSLIESLFRGLKNCFEVEPVSLNGDVTAEIDRILAEKKGEIRLAVYGPGETLHALTLHDCNAVAAMMPYFHTELYGKQDVSVVDNIIIGEMLGITHDREGTCLDYTHDAAKAVKGVDEREYQLAFLVNPVTPAVIKAVADSGDRMPRKSTYFYPKIPAGLVFYRFV
jgi:uncharacterized protein (DUF1015 family)